MHVEGNYEEFCCARWATGNLHHRVGEICYGEVIKRFGDLTLCQHHWDRLHSEIHDHVKYEEQYHFIEARLKREKEEKERRTKSVVYYLKRQDGFIKIGFSSQFKKRLATLKSKHGSLEVLATHRGSIEAESAIHNLFSSARLGTSDWFTPTEKIFSHIKQINESQRLRQVDTVTGY